ncbi:serine/threonine-protein kinase [Streptomyces sp. NPDC054863]
MTRFPENYEVWKQLGSGTQGEIFAARDIRNGTLVAIKFQQPRGFESESFFGDLTKEFDKEAEKHDLLAGIPGIPRILDRGSHRTRKYFALEFVEGVPLYDAMIGSRPLKDPMSIASIIGQLCEILHEVHERNLVHRDVKPENILLDKEGRLWLIDLGFAVEEGVPTDTRGTLLYAAPEQYDAEACKGGMTTRADIYSLGCILLEMTVMRRPYAATGERPQPGTPVLPPEFLPLVPVEFRCVALRMVDLLPENRPSAREVFECLRRYLPEVGADAPVKPLRFADPTERFRRHVPLL